MPRLLAFTLVVALTVACTSSPAPEPEPTRVEQGLMALAGPDAKADSEVAVATILASTPCLEPTITWNDAVESADDLPPLGRERTNDTLRAWIAEQDQPFQDLFRRSVDLLHQPGGIRILVGPVDHFEPRKDRIAGAEAAIAGIWLLIGCQRPAFDTTNDLLDEVDFDSSGDRARIEAAISGLDKDSYDVFLRIAAVMADEPSFHATRGCYNYDPANGYLRACES